MQDGIHLSTKVVALNAALLLPKTNLVLLLLFTVFNFSLLIDPPCCPAGCQHVSRRSWESNYQACGPWTHRWRRRFTWKEYPAGERKRGLYSFSPAAALPTRPVMLRMCQMCWGHLVVDRLMSSREKPPRDALLPLTPSNTTRAFCLISRSMVCNSQEPVSPPQTQHGGPIRQYWSLKLMPSMI